MAKRDILPKMISVSRNCGFTQIVKNANLDLNIK